MPKRDDDERFQSQRQRQERHRNLLPAEDEAPLPPPVEPITTPDSPGRNDPCPCGSGKKYKKCCAAKK